MSGNQDQNGDSSSSSNEHMFGLVFILIICIALLCLLTIALVIICCKISKKRKLWLKREIEDNLVTQKYTEQANAYKTEE